jgi:hypothetical protein
MIASALFSRNLKFGSEFERMLSATKRALAEPAK